MKPVIPHQHFPKFVRESSQWNSYTRGYEEIRVGTTKNSLNENKHQAGSFPSLYKIVCSIIYLYYTFSRVHTGFEKLLHSFEIL